MHSLTCSPLEKKKYLLVVFHWLHIYRMHEHTISSLSSFTNINIDIHLQIIHWNAAHQKPRVNQMKCLETSARQPEQLLCSNRLVMITVTGSVTTMSLFTAWVSCWSTLQALSAPFSKLCHSWLLKARGLVLCLSMPQDFWHPSSKFWQLVTPLKVRGLVSCWSTPQALLSSTLPPNSAITGYTTESERLRVVSMHAHSLTGTFPPNFNSDMTSYTTEGERFGVMLIHTPSPTFQHLSFKFCHNWLHHRRWQAWCHGYPQSKPYFPAPSNSAIIGYTTEGDRLGLMVIHTPSPTFQHLSSKHCHDWLHHSRQEAPTCFRTSMLQKITMGGPLMLFLSDGNHKRLVNQNKKQNKCTHITAPCNISDWSNAWCHIEKKKRWKKERRDSHSTTQRA